jgi:hypothetical protein
MFERLKLPGRAAPVATVLDGVSPWKHLVEDYRPVAQSLEWRLADLLWRREGVLPFIEGGVPYRINNDGRLSSDAAAVLFANCEENARMDGPIRVLEFGAGTGLFARYFLDEFRLLCERASRDYYGRLTFVVTDRSPMTIQHWREREIFRDHAGHVIAQTADAAGPGVTGEVRAVFCNYVLDVLPTAFLLPTESGWQQLCERTWIADDPAVLRQFTPLTPGELRTLADGQELERLIPILPLLECEAAFLPASHDLPPGLEDLDDVRMGVPFAFNYGAMGCLRSLEHVLDPSGFILVNDYAAAPGEENSGYPSAQRFGPCAAAGLNFPLIEWYCRRHGLEAAMPEADAARLIHARLLSRGGLPGTHETFLRLFAAPPMDASTAQVRRQADSGLAREALGGYRAAMAANPRNWQLIGEAAAFVATQLRDFETALQLAREAVELNPWYSPWLWNVLGDCLNAMGRHADAHECFQQAHRIHPRDVETNLKLAASWLVAGDPWRSLESVARGLASDSEGMFRHLLLQRQQQAIDALSIRWNAERATAARRGRLAGK